MIAAITGSCLGSIWQLGGHEGGLNLGEISSCDHGHELPTISLGDSGLPSFQFFPKIIVIFNEIEYIYIFLISIEIYCYNSTTIYIYD